MVRSFVVITLSLALGCRAAITPAAGNSTGLVGPGAQWLVPLSMQPDVRRWQVAIRAGGDTIDRPYSTRTVTQTRLASPDGAIQIVSSWPPPTTSIDTFVVVPNGLRPVGEVLRYNGYTRHFQYDGGHVWGSVQHADSVPTPYDHTFSEPVFAFNEVDLLVRSVPCRAGWSVVVPLFSEGDAALEHDTITVLKPSRAHRGGGGEDAWLVRFADPAIVSTYVVLGASREIVSVDAQQRRTGAVIHYRD